MSKLSYQQFIQLVEGQIVEYRDRALKHPRLSESFRDQAHGAHMLWIRATPDHPRRMADKDRLAALVESIGEPVEQPVKGAA